MAVLLMPPIRKRQHAWLAMLLRMFPAAKTGVCFQHPKLGGNSMLKRLIIALALMGFLGAVTLPSYTTAQTTTTDDTKTKKKAPAKKKDEKADAKADTKADDQKAKTATKKKAPTAKQFAARKKFSDCAKNWGDHKKATGEKTRKQYNAYMSKCLKKDG
jgi:hypothetical protein